MQKTQVGLGQGHSSRSLKFHSALCVLVKRMLQKFNADALARFCPSVLDFRHKCVGETNTEPLQKQ